MHVGNVTTFWPATVELYSLNSYLKYSGASENIPRGETINGAVVNFVADITDMQSNTTDPSMPPVAPGSYLLKIGNKYCTLTIPNFNPAYNADFVLQFVGGVFTRIDNAQLGRQISISATHTWTGYDVIVKNSFNLEGIMSLDNINFTIPAAGTTFTWEQSSFPHRFEAKDQKPDDLDYWQRFYSWTVNGSNETYDRVKSISTGNNIYQANFKNEYNINFQNSFSGTTGGVIKVNGTQQNAPYQTTVLQYDSISATAITNSINGISYSFSHWSDGSTQGYNHYFSPSDDTTCTAYYIGKANNASRNLHFNASANQPITVIWSEHPDSNVTKYQIWRRIKYKKQATSNPVLIGTVNRGTTTFVDYDYAGPSSGFTDWILWYDVKSYFSLDGTYSDDDFVLVFSDGPLAKKNVNISNNITENKIDNYPNPFNPSTVITYQIVNPGYVTLKIYDNLGREVVTLVNEEKNAGKYYLSFDGTNLSSGIYFYRIIANSYTETKKMILTK